MTGLERLENLVVELWNIFKPTDAMSLWQLIALVGLLMIAWLTRKEQGGFIKAILRMIGAMILLLILNAVSPYLMWGVIGFTVFWMLCDKLKIPLKTILLIIVILAAAAFAYYNVFMT